MISPRVHKRTVDVDVSVFCSAIAVIVGLITNFAGLLPETVKYIFYTISLGFGFFAIFFAIFFTKQNDIRKYLIIWCIIIFYLLTIGAIRSNLYTDNFSKNIFLAQDLRFVMYVGIGILLASSSRLESFHKIILVISYISIVFGVIALAHYNFDYARASEGSRLGIWNLPYYLWWASCGVFAYMYAYYRITGKNKVAGIGSFVIYALLGLLFIKRSVVVNSVVIITISEILTPRHKQKRTRYEISRIIKAIFIIMIAVGILMYIPYTRVLIRAMLERFNYQGNIFEYDRAIEGTEYFHQASISEIILGQGIGHYVITTGQELNALHTGLYNLIYKGGVVLLAIYLYFCLGVFRAFLHKKQMQTNQLVCLAVSMSYIVSMFYEASWSYTIYMFQYVTPMVYLLTSKQHSSYE